MPTPNDSIAVTPGTGVDVATQLVGSKEYQAVMVADAAGQLINDPTDVFVSIGLAMAKAASRNYHFLWNGDASKVVDILGAFVQQESTAAVIGLIRGYRLYRVTGFDGAMTTGTAQTPEPLDTASAALDADIDCWISGGSGIADTSLSIASNPLSALGISEEETGAAGAARTWLWNVNEMGFAIPVRPSEGLIIQQDATAGTGLISTGMIFRVRA